MANLKPGTARINMLGTRANVNVYCNYVREGKVTFRDIGRNLDISISKADPDALANFLDSIKQHLSGRPRKHPFTEKFLCDQSNSNKKAKLHEGFGDNKQATEPGSKLSKEQQTAVKMALEGTSFFLTGGAGTGKSLVLGEIIKALPKQTTYVTGTRVMCIFKTTHTC